MSTPLEQNACDLELELAWFGRVLDARFRQYFQREAGPESGGRSDPPPALTSVFEIDPPDFQASTSHYAGFLRHYSFSFIERVALVLALVPHIRPQLLDLFFTKNQNYDRRFTEFGGARMGVDGDFLPTGETLAFVLGGDDLVARFAVAGLFDAGHAFASHNILRLAPNAADDPPLKAPLRLSEDVLCLITTGRVRRPDFGIHFPARFIETRLTWSDLVLHPVTRRQIAEIETWLDHGDTLLHDWEMAAKLRPGYRALFYGPPGTGKTITACLLGQSTGRDVYKIDLSLVVSKYIGETEKNLSRVFDQAQHKNWILFFDEADALFGKRTATKDAHDRYANQEVSFLLQRIETFDGIAILASNQRENLDEAFTRRFESIIYFPLPRPEERRLLWRQGFSAKAQLDPAIDLGKLASEHALAGGSIMNVIRYASLQALGSGDGIISFEALQQGIRQELAKEGRGI